jgi:hypothetical protein
VSLQENGTGALFAGKQALVQAFGIWAPVPNISRCCWLLAGFGRSGYLLYRQDVVPSPEWRTMR